MIPIKVIDSPMGAGKTSYLIKHMKNAPKDNKFLFITPFLDEVILWCENPTPLCVGWIAQYKKCV